jgi:hypothetical protein
MNNRNGFARMERPSHNAVGEGGKARKRRTIMGTKRLARLAVCIATLMTSMVAATPRAQAVASSEPRGATATFRGRTLNLRESWGKARSCVVYASRRVDCYTSNAEADAAIAPGGTITSFAVAALPACARGWLCLYEHINGGGRRLIFQNDYWQNLAAYGFGGQVSSWRNNQSSSDWAFLSRNADGSGGYINLSPRGYASSMGDFNDWAWGVQG